MAIQPDVYVSSQEYLALEKQAVYKSEYITGAIVAMSGTRQYRKSHPVPVAWSADHC